MHRPLRRSVVRQLAAVAGLVVVSTVWAVSLAGAAVPRTGTVRVARTTTTLAPATTTVPTTLPPPTTAAPATTVPQASTDTPTSTKQGTVAADPAQKRLRLIIGGLVGLAVIILIVTIWFWRATGPGRRVTVTELTTDEEPVEADASGPVASGPEPWPVDDATAGGGPTTLDALPVMNVNQPLPSSPGTAPIAPARTPPAAQPAAVPPAAATVPPRSPADLYPPSPVAVAPPSPADPDPPAFERDPDPPKFEEPTPTEVVPVVGHAEPDPGWDDLDEEAPDEDEAWQPRRLPEPPSGDGEWRGIRPLGPVQRGD